MLLRILSFCSSLTLLNAQPVGAGLKAGLPINDAFHTTGQFFTADRTLWTAGPYVELRLPLRFAIEADALYEGVKFNYLQTPSFVSASTWQFPLLLKYRFSSGTFRPYLAGGVAAYRIGGVDQNIAGITQWPSAVRDAVSKVENSFVNGGGVVGGGLEIKAGPLRISPEIRFTRWALSKSVGASGFTLRSEQSRTQFLVGIGF